jgi:hypothetical protein
MSTEPQFLSFKGLKQYTPEGGWGQPHAPMADNVPTLTETADAHAPASAMFDPLINELFEQLRVPPSDALTQTWRTIAAEVNLLTERMALQRELQERLQKLEQDVLLLRGTIMSHLTEVQQVADQQLASARLRTEVSALAQTKLAAKLNTHR